MKLRYLKCWLPALLWMGAIFYLSSWPDLPGPPDAVWDLVLKKVAHVLVYGLLAGLYVVGLGHGQSVPTRTLRIAGVLTALYAASDEVHQYFVPGRHGRLSDWLIDMGGAIVMLLLLRRVPGFVQEAPAAQ